MNEFNEPPDDLLTQLVQETCKYPHDSLERKQWLTKIMFLMQQSGKIWRGRNQVNPEDYHEALQENWYFFCCNLCRQDPTAKKPYDAQKANVITWFNNYLDYKIREIISRRKTESLDEFIQIDELNTGKKFSAIELIHARSEESILMIEAFLKWLEENQQRLSRIHLRDRPDINAHLIISRRLILEETYTTIHQEFNVPIPTLSKFYKDRCLPIIKKWADEQGY